MNNDKKILPRSYIYYDPERIDYSLTPEEFEKLRDGGKSLWKDVCLVCISIGIPSLVNALAETNRQAQFQLTLSIFLNFLFGILGIFLGIVFGIAWHRDHQSLKNLEEAIKQKPKMELPNLTNVGALDSPSENHQPENLDNK